MRRIVIGSVLLGLCAVSGSGIAFARPQYRGAFVQMYGVRPGSTLDRAQCNVCHAGPNKRVRNPYGMDLAQALGKQNAAPQEAAAAAKKIENNLSPDKKTK